MSAKPELPDARVAGFRTKLLVAIMLVFSGVTLAALYIAERGLVAKVEEDLQREFQAELTALASAQEVRRGALMERCRALVRKSRIRAALEDDALDLLYDAAAGELIDILVPAGIGPAEMPAPALHAEFYRFLDLNGRVIAPAKPRAVGLLTREDEQRLALPAVPTQPQVGYMARETAEGATVISDIIAMPIHSSETGEIIAALVLGFRPFQFGRSSEERSGMKSGIWLEGRLHSTTLPAVFEPVLSDHVNRAGGRPVRVTLEREPHLLFSKHLNPHSAYPAAYETCVYSLADLVTRQRQLRWQVLGAGSMLLLVGLAGSHLMATRLSAPVEKLAVDSAENRTQRVRVEAALEMTSAELQRSVRFSADASHQLKTPVTVLRAGLEELLSRENLTPEECAEISALIHQTYRLSTLIEDLLLLSRMDAGRLKLAFEPVDLSALIEASLDDLSALPDDHDVTLETAFPAGLHILGEKRYTAIILQNLLENARKYNHRRGGRIGIHASVQADDVRLTIGNTGRPISAEGQAHIFERFHRGVMGENVPGYGLGLNLARELARLHQGDLRLLRSDEAWTEFEVRFRLAHLAPTAPTA